MKIIAETCSEAHEAAFDVIVNSHSELDIKTHEDKEEFTLEYLSTEPGDDFLHIKVLHPEQEPQVSPGCLFGKGGQKVEEYKKQFLTLTPPRVDGKEAVYTYFNRIKDHPFPSPFVQNSSGALLTWLGDGRGDGFDQIVPLINKLAKDPGNRRGVIVTWNPILDATSKEPPCMDMIQFVIRGKFLHMRVVFRSQDMLSGLGPNLAGCAAFFRMVLDGINAIRESRRLASLEMGTLTLISLIPHIYKVRDSEEYHMMRERIYNLKMQKKWRVVIKE